MTLWRGSSLLLPRARSGATGAGSLAAESWVGFEWVKLYPRGRGERSRLPSSRSGRRRSGKKLSEIEAINAELADIRQASLQNLSYLQCENTLQTQQKNRCLASLPPADPPTWRGGLSRAKMILLGVGSSRTERPTSIPGDGYRITKTGSSNDKN